MALWLVLTKALMSAAGTGGGLGQMTAATTAATTASEKGQVWEREWVVAMALQSAFQRDRQLEQTKAGWLGIVWAGLLEKETEHASAVETTAGLLTKE
jgi:hypothetical protein